MEKSDGYIKISPPCAVADLDTATALSAAEIGATRKLSTADAIIYATALAYNADLLTGDKHFQGLPTVLYVPKSSP